MNADCSVAGFTMPLRFLRRLDTVLLHRGSPGGRIGLVKLRLRRQ